jgi:hypothetical protein
MKGSLNERL